MPQDFPSRFTYAPNMKQKEAPVRRGIRISKADWLGLGLVLQFFWSVPSSAYSSRDASTIFSSYNTAFYSVNGTNGYFKDTQTGGIAYFWGQAEMIECVIDVWDWSNNPSCQGMITNLLNGFLKNNGSSWSYNIYNDDILWAVIAFARGGQATGRSNYCQIARSNFDTCYARAWDAKLGGGLYWRTDNASKNACVNGPGAIAAYLLYQIYGDTNYLAKAASIYAWERSTLFNPTTGAIYDNIGTNGVISTWASTYNQGTFIGAANFLGLTNDAKLAANYAMMNLSGGGILPEYGIAGNNSGFNAIFLRWMNRFMRNRNLQSIYRPWLQFNAAAAWNQRRLQDNLSWCQWTQPSPPGTNFYSWDCISSFSMLQAADPTQIDPALAVPRNPVGHWSLDAGTGTIASNAAWNGNHMTLNGTIWNGLGRFGGCLSFNGSTSYAQIINPLANDFTISLWLKTTQTAGTPQWYNGAGLLDGDTPSNSNDFGTALVGGKFGFGVGNPDTTILSTTSVNDGAWHHCVATRLEASGKLSIYVDGNLQSTGTATKNTLNAPASLRLGAIASGNGFFVGSLDDIRVFDRTLTATDVAALYSSSMTAPSTAPTGLTAVGGNGKVRLTWSDAPLATSYNIKRSLVNGGPYTMVTNVVTTTFVNSGLPNNRTYSYVVSPVNAQGEGINSSQVSATPSTLILWLKAESLSGTTNGAPVSSWPDLTGNGYDAIQTLNSNQPTYVTNAMNGLPALRFNSTNASHLWIYRPVQDDFTIILVCRSAQGIGTSLNFWEGAGLISGEQNGAVNDFGISLNANGQFLAGAGNPDTSIRSGTGFTNGQPHVVSFKRTRSTGFLTLYVDGAQVAAANGGTASLTAPNVLVLGAQGTLNNYFSGDIGELQIYGSALADADRQALERSLKCKYALTGGGTLPAPTGLTGTAGNRRVFLNWAASVGATTYTLLRSTNEGASYETVAADLPTCSHVDMGARSGQLNLYKVAANNTCGAGTASPVTSVLLPLPSLTVTTYSSGLSMSWPAWAVDWGLFYTTNLEPPTVWSPVTNTASTNSGQFSVAVPTTTGRRFYRLSSP